MRVRREVKRLKVLCRAKRVVEFLEKTGEQLQLTPYANQSIDQIRYFQKKLAATENNEEIRQLSEKLNKLLSYTEDGWFNKFEGR